MFVDQVWLRHVRQQFAEHETALAARANLPDSASFFPAIPPALPGSEAETMPYTAPADDIDDVVI